MLFRRGASVVDAIHLDGGEAALRAVMALPGARAAARPDGIEISSELGRRTATAGRWVTRDRATGALRVVDAGTFADRHEAI